ncbi:TniQ family protein [Thiolapillus sp.]|uniref:TniQ family protein n=2 Tax=Thiolapillus sp. TaxID=2017437 RepID=UPI003AF72262
MNQPSMPFLPHAQPGESPLSLLRRAALGNGYPSLISFAFSMNPYLDYSDTGLGTLARSPLLFRATCATLGMPEDEVNLVVYERCGCGRMDHLLWNGLQVAPGDLQFRRSRMCIACYLEHGYAFAEWDHVAAYSCAQHKVLLTDACPVCHAPWDWNRTPFSCGCDPEAMAHRQQTCSKEPAGLLHRLVEQQEQAGLRLYTALHSVVNWWRALGLINPGVPLVTALASLLHGNWPEEPDAPTGPPAGEALHPRTLLAPLLASRDADLVAHGTLLLAKPSRHQWTGQLGDITWHQHTAMAVLGIGRVPFARLKKDGHLLSADRHRIRAVSVNALLLLASHHVEKQETADPLPILLARYRNRSLSAVISSIVNREGSQPSISEASPSDYVQDKGGQTAGGKSEGPYFTLAEATRRLKTNPESVRGVISAGLLQAKRGGHTNAVQWLIEEEALRAFDRRYVFGSTVAREQGASPTTFSNRLRSAGAVPVSGPGIDSGATFLFLREEIEKLDLESIREAPYSSPAGRKTAAARRKSTDQMTTALAAESLGVDPRAVRTIVSQGWITPLDREARYLSFRKAEVLSLAARLNQNYQDLEIAAEATGQSVHAFRRTWIDTGFINGHRFGNRTIIAYSDLQKVLSVWDEAATGTEIGKQLGRHRYLCSNLKKMGRLKPCYVLGTGSKKVFLYPRNDPLLRHYQLDT